MIKFSAVLSVILLTACGNDAEAPFISDPWGILDAGTGGRSSEAGVTPPEASMPEAALPEASTTDASNLVDAAPDGNVCPAGLVETPTAPEHDSAAVCDSPMRCGESCGTCQGVTEGAQGCCAAGEVFYEQQTCSSGACTFYAVRGLCCPQGVFNFWQCRILTTGDQ